MFPRADGALRWWPSVVLAGCLAMLAGCAGEVPTPEVQRLVILTNASAPFWDAANKGADDAETELKLADAKLDVVFEKNTKGTEGQIEKLRQFAGAGDIAGIAISVSDPSNAALVEEMRKLRKSGVKVITLDSDIDRATARDARYAYIGTDNVVGGRELGIAAQGLLPAGGQFASFVGYKGQGNAIERNQGFMEGAGPAFEQAAWLGDEVDEVVARKNVRDALDNNSQIKLLVGIWSYNTPAIIDVVKERNIRGQVKVVGFDADPPSIAGMGNGMVDAMVVQNPYEMGYQSVRLLKALVADDKAVIKEMFPAKDEDKEQGDIFHTNLKVVVPGPSSPLKKEMFGKTTEFLTLDEFKAWLNKYGLSGS